MTPAEKAAKEIANEIQCEYELEEVKPFLKNILLDIIQDAIDESLPKWEPIDSAPKDSTSIVLFIPDYGDEIVMGWSDDGKTWEIEEGLEFKVEDDWHYPTHWMPLPQPPEDAR